MNVEMLIFLKFLTVNFLWWITIFSFQYFNVQKGVGKYLPFPKGFVYFLFLQGFCLLSLFSLLLKISPMYGWIGVMTNCIDLFSNSFLGFENQIHQQFESFPLENPYILKGVCSMINMTSLISVFVFYELFSRKKLQERMLNPKIKYSKFLILNFLLLSLIFVLSIIFNFLESDEKTMIGKIFTSIFESFFSYNSYFQGYELPNIWLRLLIVAKKYLFGLPFSFNVSIISILLLYKLNSKRISVLLVFLICNILAEIIGNENIKLILLPIQTLYLCSNIYNQKPRFWVELKI